MKTRNTATVTTIILILFTFIAVSTYIRQSQLTANKGKAVIYDPLSTQTDTFTQQCSETLTRAGYKVHTLKGENATVEAIAGLNGYGLIVFRAHSGVFEDEVWIFTGEEFSSSRHVLEQVSGEVHLARSPNDPRLYFAVGPSFFKLHVADGLKDTVVLLMGCDTMKDSSLAEALCGCGAAAVAGWDGPVNLDVSDNVFTGLVGELCTGKPLGEAVEACTGEGLECTLQLYPAEAGDRSLTP